MITAPAGVTATCTQVQEHGGITGVLMETAITKAVEIGPAGGIKVAAIPIMAKAIGAATAIENLTTDTIPTSRARDTVGDQVLAVVTGSTDAAEQRTMSEEKSVSSTGCGDPLLSSFFA